MDSECTHTGIDKKLVKEEKIKTEPMDISFEVFNVDGIKNGKVTRYVPLEIKVNEYMEKINIMVTNLNKTNIFLRYDWLVKYNLEVNWKIDTIQFTKCLRTYKTQY